jgi:hypothetical protein
LAFSMLQAMPMIVWFWCSTMSFCYDEYGAVRWRTTPWSTHVLDELVGHEFTVAVHPQYS